MSRHFAELVFLKGGMPHDLHIFMFSISHVASVQTGYNKTLEDQIARLAKQQPLSSPKNGKGQNHGVKQIL